MSELKRIETPNAPAAVGAYSQAVVAGNFVFTSASLPMDPVSRAIPDDVKAQATVSMQNIKALLEAAGTSMGKVVKASIFLTDMDDFSVVNEVYSTYFTQPFPARSCFAVKTLPLGSKVGIEVVAML